MHHDRITDPDPDHPKGAPPLRGKWFQGLSGHVFEPIRLLLDACFHGGIASLFHSSRVFRLMTGLPDIQFPHFGDILVSYSNYNPEE